MNGLPVRVDGRVAPGGRERHGGLPVLVLGAWAALVLNVLTFLDLPILIPIPASLGRLIAQAALPLALVLALAANPRCVLRRNVFLSLVTALALLSLLASLHNDFPFGSIYRALRLLGLVAVLWVLTPWWGRADLVLLRCHLRCLWVVLASVVIGAFVAPGDAFWLEGRLGGALWPIPPTQVGHYAAVAAGTTILLWLCRGVSGRLALLGLAVALPVLLLSHTRTALLALGIGLVLAAGSLFLGHVRVRRTSAVGAALGIVVAAAFAREITTWALRGQSTEEAGELTGRTEVWAAAMAAPRPVMERLFGSGLGDQSFQGLPVDSDWVAAYLDQGWVGIAFHAALLLVLLLMAAVRESGLERAIALFLVVYELVASITETTLVSPSPYLLELTVAASLLARRAPWRPV